MAEKGPERMDPKPILNVKSLKSRSTSTCASRCAGASSGRDRPSTWRRPPASSASARPPCATPCSSSSRRTSSPSCPGAWSSSTPSAKGRPELLRDHRRPGEHGPAQGLRPPQARRRREHADPQRRHARGHRGRRLRRLLREEPGLPRHVPPALRQRQPGQGGQQPQEAALRLPTAGRLRQGVGRVVHPGAPGPHRPHPLGHPGLWRQSSARRPLVVQGPGALHPRVLPGISGPAE
ncbi:MAG: hypothetical protein MZW92_75805 [Comamonadaceae bacterium]|nr:hypothetical protein [Comamonadaceae bacterium]